MSALSGIILAACGGFLLAVLWMDLMFDVQVLPYRDRSGELPEPVLASIAAYYRRVTTTAHPMNRLVAAVMLTAVATLIVEAFAGRGPLWLPLAGISFAGTPIALAVTRIIPSAVRLGTRTDTTERQSELARSICRDHFFCLAAVAGFVALQLYGVLR